MLLVCSITLTASARCLGGNGFDSRPQIGIWLKVPPARIDGMNNGNGRTIQGFVVCNSFDVSVFGATTLLTVPRSINRISLDRSQ